jgi:hypothetical protein
MTVPSTIAEALEMNKRPKQQENPKVAATNTVDLLVVIVNHSIMQSPPASAASSSSFPKAKILITDDSINSTGMTVSVLLYGSSAVARVTEEQLAKGDLVRFNGVSLRNGNDTDEDSFEFHYSWTNPQPGIEWWRLGNMDRHGKFIDKDTLRRIPDSMQTSPIRFNEFVQWCQHKDEVFVDSPGLTPLPCQRRLLNDIQSSAGLLSNVVVRMLDYDCHRQLQSITATSRKRKRASTQFVTGFATLTDGFGTVMTLVDPGSRFASSLKTAKDSGKWLTLTNLLSKRGQDIQDQMLPWDEIVLVPTTTTEVIQLSHENGYYDEPTSTPNHTETQHLTLPRNESTLASRVRDFLMDGVSIKGECLNNTKCFLSKLLTGDGQYREASLLLDNVTVFAEARVVQCLCGGVDSGELIREEQMAHHVRDLVRALLNEPIVFYWTIETNDDKKRARAIKVGLKNIPKNTH